MKIHNFAEPIMTLQNYKKKEKNDIFDKNLDCPSIENHNHIEIFLQKPKYLITFAPLFMCISKQTNQQLNNQQIINNLSWI